MIYYSDNFADYNDNKLEVKWTKVKWDDHIQKHPEIRSPKNTSALISETLLEPSLVMLGTNPLTQEAIRCYYKERKRNQNDIYFTKVVVGCGRNPFYVKTIFMQWLFWHLVVQEKKYNNFKEIWRDPKTYL